MGRTYTNNTRYECVGYDEFLGCRRLTNGKYMRPIDCSKCWAYEVVEDKAKYWSEVDKECEKYGATFVKD